MDRTPYLAGLLGESLSSTIDSILVSGGDMTSFCRRFDPDKEVLRLLTTYSGVPVVNETNPRSTVFMTRYFQVEENSRKNKLVKKSNRVSR